MKTEANGRMIQKTDKSAEKELAPVDLLANHVNRMRGAIEQVLPKHLTADRMLRVAIMAVRTTPHLAECTTPSVIASLMACSMLGLEPNSPLHQAYLIPYFNKKIGSNGAYECQLIIDYRGKIDLARRSGEIASIQAHAVYAADEWDYELGLTPSLKHKPSKKPGRVSPEKLEYVYCVVKLKEPGTEPIFVVLSRDEIELRRKRGASGHTNKWGKPISTPWDTDYEKMAKKTAVHECMTWAPRSAEMALADDIEERSERGASILPALPDSVASAMLAGGTATERDLSDTVDVDPDDAEGEQPEKSAKSEPPPPKNEVAPSKETKSDPSSASSVHIFPSEIKDIKKLAQEEGNEELADICERALTGDSSAKAQVIAVRDSKPQREIE